MDFIQQLRITVNQYSEFIERRGVRLEDELEPGSCNLDADEKTVSAACHALIKNAIAFNRPNGRILLQSFQTEKAVEVIVADTGIGINHQQLKVLKPEIENGLRQTGLSNVWQLIQKTNGRWLIESQTKVGTQITLQWALRK